MSSYTSNTPKIMPRQTMQGHTSEVRGIVHLPDGRRIITCSVDGSLRLWDLESGAQIGEDWRDESYEVWSIALSPDGKTIASGGNDNKVKLWDVETTRVIANWAGHRKMVCSLCWSADGKRVASGSWDGRSRIWDVDTGTSIRVLTTGNKWVWATMYSPDSLKLATGGSNRNNVKIRDVKSRYKGLNLLKHPNAVSSLAWTSDGNKLITGSRGSIRIFDTTTWQQIAILEGHTDWVSAISLSRNDLLASASWDQTARLWNIDTSLQVGLPLPHENELSFVALSPDAKVLVTGCKNGNLYTWDIQEILKETGLGDPLPIGTNIVSVKYHPHTLSLTVSAVRHQKTVSNRMHPKVIYKYSTHPALRSVTGHFWKYVLYFNPSHSL